MIRMADALIVSEARHKTLAGLYRLLVDPPDASNGADSLRISPWTADDLRAPTRRFTVADLVAHATQTNEWTLYVSLDDSLGEKDKGTRHLEAVEYHHDPNQSQGKKNPRYTNGTVHVEVRLALGLRSYAYDWRLYLREKTVRRLNRQRAPEHRLHFRKKTSLARDMLEGLQQLLPSGFRVSVRFDSWYASNRLLQWCRRQGWHVICAIKSNRKLGDKKLTTWPQALRHQRYQRVLLTATDGRHRTYLVRSLQGKLNKLSFAVCVLISKRHHRDKRPKYFLCTDLALSALEILPIYHKRWPIEVCQTQPIKMTWCPLRLFRHTGRNLRGGFKRENEMDVHRFSRNDDFADQALGYGLTFFKRKLCQILAQQLAKGLGIVNDLLPMDALLPSLG